MTVRLHPHARDRLKERGATPAEVIHTVRHGRRARAKFGRTMFSHLFPYNAQWHGNFYASKRVEAFAAKEPDATWLVITVIVKFF